MQFIEALWTSNVLRDQVWDPQHKISLSFRGMELAGEVGELLNQLKKIERISLGLVGSPPNMVKMYEEIADVMICISLVCMHLKITPHEFVASVIDKFNATSLERGLDVFMAHPNNQE